MKEDSNNQSFSSSDDTAGSDDFVKQMMGDHHKKNNNIQSSFGIKDLCTNLNEINLREDSSDIGGSSSGEDGLLRKGFVLCKVSGSQNNDEEDTMEIPMFRNNSF